MKRALRRILCVLMVMLMFSTTAPAALAASLTAYINANTKVYQKPSTSSATLKVPKGTKVQITAVKGNWAQVYRAGVTAYMNVGQLTLASRAKGYAMSGTRLYKSASTSSASIALDVNTAVYVIGRYNNFWRVQNADGSITGYVLMSKVSGSKVATSDPRDKVVMLDWYKGGSDVLPRGGYGTLYDILSGEYIRVKRMGGSNHADLEPATAADTAILLDACGGEFSWDSRPVILIANGKYVACAINTLPHGDQTILNNNYEGQFCLHMINSRTHGSDSINTTHQSAISYAYSWAQQG